MSDHGHHHEPTTATMRAMSATASWLDRLNRWWKRGLIVVAVLVAVRGVYEWGETAYGVVGDFGPLQTQFRAHRAAFDGHVEEFVGHEEAHQGEHGEFHRLADTLLRAIGSLKERTDTVATRQQWLACLEGQDRDREAGRPVRDCEPFGGAP